MEDVGAADRCTIRLHRRIRLPAVDRSGLVEQIRIARNAVIAGFAAIGIGMNSEIATAGIEQDAAIDAAVDGTDGRSGFDRDAGRRLHVRERRLRRQSVGLERCGRACWQGVRDAIVGCADDAADRCRSVAHRRRTADDFDLVCRQWIDRNEMVFAKIGSAAGVDAIFGDADAIDVETSNDRPARGARRKGRAGNTGLGKEEIAELGSAVAANFLVRHHGDGRKLIRDDGQHALLRRGSSRCGLWLPARARGCGRARCGRRAPAFARERLPCVARSGLAPSR